MPMLNVLLRRVDGADGRRVLSFNPGTVSPACPCYSLDLLGLSAGNQSG